MAPYLGPDKRDATINPRQPGTHTSLDLAQSSTEHDQPTEEVWAQARQGIIATVPPVSENFHPSSTVKVRMQGGHTATLVQQSGVWIASVDEDLPIGFSRQIDLPVYGAPELLNVEAFKHNPSWYAHHIQVVFPEQDKINQRGCAYVGKTGLMGGGKNCKGCGNAKDNLASCGDCFNCCQHVGKPTHAQQEIVIEAHQPASSKLSLLSTPSRPVSNLPSSFPELLPLHRSDIPANLLFPIKPAIPFPTSNIAVVTQQTPPWVQAVGSSAPVLVALGQQISDMFSFNKKLKEIERYYKADLEAYIDKGKLI